MLRADDGQYTVRVYNPFYNREEYYTWDDFYDAWWAYGRRRFRSCKRLQAAIEARHPLPMLGWEQTLVFGFFRTFPHLKLPREKEPPPPEGAFSFNLTSGSTPAPPVSETMGKCRLE